MPGNRACSTAGSRTSLKLSERAPSAASRLSSRRCASSRSMPMARLSGATPLRRLAGPPGSGPGPRVGNGNRRGYRAGRQESHSSAPSAASSRRAPGDTRPPRHLSASPRTAPWLQHIKHFLVDGHLSTNNPRAGASSGATPTQVRPGRGDATDSRLMYVDRSARTIQDVSRPGDVVPALRTWLSLAHEEATDMDMTELCYTTATALERAMRDKELSPLELIDAVLARIEAVNPRINAYCTVAADQAREAARAAERQVMQGE